METVNWDNGLLVGRRNDDGAERSARTSDPNMRGIGLTVTDMFMHEDTPGQDMLIPNPDGHEYQSQPQQRPAPPPSRLQQQPPDPVLDPETVLSLAPDGENNEALGDQAEAIPTDNQQQELSTPRQPTLTGGTEDTGAFVLAGMGAQFDTGEARSGDIQV